VCKQDATSRETRRINDSFMANPVFPDISLRVSVRSIAKGKDDHLLRGLRSESSYAFSGIDLPLLLLANIVLGVCLEKRGLEVQTIAHVACRQ